MTATDPNFTNTPNLSGYATLPPSYPAVKARLADFLGKPVENISDAVQAFFDQKLQDVEPRFTANQLRFFVQNRLGASAPGSADRIMRMMKKAGKLNYQLLNRSKSFYLALPVEAATEAQ